MKFRTYLPSLATFAVWMMASFLCHKMAKTAMGLYVDGMTSSPFYVIPLLVTLVQLFCCYSAFSVTWQNSLFSVIVAAHFLATLTTNVSLALTFASSTMAIKMLEPLTTAVLQRLLLKAPLGLESAGGVVAAVAGAFLYVGNPSNQGSGNGNGILAIIVAVLSNLSFGIRNVAIKISHDNANFSPPPTNRLRPASTVVCAFVCAVVFIALVEVFTPPQDAHSGSSFILLTPKFADALFLSLVSGACHVLYSYVSTNLVLRYMSVVSHALANILKRVLVVLLLHVSGVHRETTPWNWAGLVLCTAGMLFYSWKKKKILSSSGSLPSLSSGSLPSPSSSSSHHQERSHDEDEKGQATLVALGEEIQTKAKHMLMLLLLTAVVTANVMVVGTVTRTKVSKFAQQDNYFPGLSAPVKLRSMYEGNPVAAHYNRLEEDLLDTLFGPQNPNEVVSRVLKSNPAPKPKSQTDYALNLRFGHEKWIDGDPLIAGPVSFQPDRKSRREVEEFLSREHLLGTPNDTDGLSPYLTTARDVIRENQRVHLNLFRDLLRGKKYAVLFELSSIENKGDSALTIGELIFLERLGVKLLAYVSSLKCQWFFIRRAVKIAEGYPQDEVVMLIHGGGNLVYMSELDGCRGRYLPLIRNYQQVMFSNSFYMRDTRRNFENFRNLFCCNPNMTMLFRDRLSLHIAQKLFTGGTRLVLAPDMAMEIGYVGTFAAPYHDIVWQRRKDTERAVFDRIPPFPPNLSVHEWDWLNMPSIKSAHSIRRAMNVMHNGFQILLQGRVVVTDRLHGHILSLLLDIPHVLLDNSDQKLSTFHNTWTRGVRNCRLTDNAEDAARLALELLEEYEDVLPKRIRSVDLPEPKET